MGMFRGCGAEEKIGVKIFFSHPAQGVKNALGEQNRQKQKQQLGNRSTQVN